MTGPRERESHAMRAKSHRLVASLKGQKRRIAESFLDAYAKSDMPSFGDVRSQTLADLSSKTDRDLAQQAINQVSKALDATYRSPSRQLKEPKPDEKPSAPTPGSVFGKRKP